MKQIDYGVYDDKGYPIKTPKFCAVTHKQLHNVKRTHRVLATQLFYCTSPEIIVTSDDIQQLNDAVLQQYETDNSKQKKRKTKSDNQEVNHGD